MKNSMKYLVYAVMMGVLLLLTGCKEDKFPNLGGKYHSNVYLSGELVESIDIEVAKLDSKKNSYKINFIAKNSDNTDITEVSQEFEIINSSKGENEVLDLSIKELGNGQCSNRYEWDGEMKKLEFNKVKITTLQFIPKSETSKQKITVVFQFENENSYSSVGIGYSAVGIPLKESN